MAIDTIWQNHSIRLACDFVAILGVQVFYESYFYQKGASVNLVDVEFLWQVAPTIGYPDLWWAVTSSEELLTLALRNPQLETSYVEEVRQWAADNLETAFEEVDLTDALEQREQAVSVAVL